MQCTMCGREITNPEANYCEYCGTALGNVAYREEQVQQPKVTEEKKDKVPMTSFLGVMCLQFIPMVGSIAYLVFLFYWAFASDVQDSRKSYARAALIYFGIVLVLAILMVGAFVGVITSAMANMF